MDWTIEFDKAIEQYLPDLEVLQDVTFTPM